MRRSAKVKRVFFGAAGNRQISTSLILAATCSSIRGDHVDLSSDAVTPKKLNIRDSWKVLYKPSAEVNRTAGHPQFLGIYVWGLKNTSLQKLYNMSVTLNCLGKNVCYRPHIVSSFGAGPPTIRDPSKEPTQRTALVLLRAPDGYENVMMIPEFKIHAGKDGSMIQSAVPARTLCIDDEDWAQECTLEIDDSDRVVGCQHCGCPYKITGLKNTVPCFLCEELNREPNVDIRIRIYRKSMPDLRMKDNDPPYYRVVQELLEE